MKSIIMLFFLLPYYSANAQQTYTIDSLKCYVVDRWSDCTTSSDKGKLVKFQDDQFYFYRESSSPNIYKVIKKGEPDVFMNEGCKVFSYKGIDPKSNTCEFFLSFPPVGSGSTTATLMIDWDNKYRLMYYLKAF